MISIGKADEWALVLAWIVHASWRDVRPAAGQHLTRIKRKRDWKTDHVLPQLPFARRILSKEGDSIITSENNYYHKQSDSVVVCHFPLI